MFGCNNKQTVLHPNKEQKQINENQLKLMKDKCEGKEFCSALACESWWNTKLKCSSAEPAMMWLHWHCHGIPGEGTVVTKPDVGCEDGTKHKTSVSAISSITIHNITYKVQ